MRPCCRRPPPPPSPPPAPAPALRAAPPRPPTAGPQPAAAGRAVPGRGGRQRGAAAATAAAAADPPPQDLPGAQRCRSKQPAREDSEQVRKRKAPHAFIHACARGSVCKSGAWFVPLLLYLRSLSLSPPPSTHLQSPSPETPNPLRTCSSLSPGAFSSAAMSSLSRQLSGSRSRTRAVRWQARPGRASSVCWKSELNSRWDSCERVLQALSSCMCVCVCVCSLHSPSPLVFSALPSRVRPSRVFSSHLLFLPHPTPTPPEHTSNPPHLWKHIATLSY